MKTQKQNGRRCNAGRHDEQSQAPNQKPACPRRKNETPMYRKPADILQIVRRLAEQIAARARCIPEEGAPAR
ncbi:MAG: hypothetical protein ACKVYV_14255 [Limisphaerales bacterium]